MQIHRFDKKMVSLQYVIAYDFSIGNCKKIQIHRQHKKMVFLQCEFEDVISNSVL